MSYKAVIHRPSDSKSFTFQASTVSELDSQVAHWRSHHNGVSCARSEGVADGKDFEEHTVTEFVDGKEQTTPLRRAWTADWQESSSCSYCGGS